MLINSLIYAGISIASFGIMKKIKIPGINSGRGSYKAISKQITTKFQHGIIKSISKATFGKMFISELYENLAGSALETGYNSSGLESFMLGII